MNTNEAVQANLQVNAYMINKGIYDTLQLDQIIYPNWIISHVKEGRVLVSSSGEQHIVEAGGVMIHPPFVPFSEYSDRPGLHEWMSVSLYTRYHLDLFQLYPVKPVLTLKDPEGYSRVFQHLLNAWEQGGAFREITISGCILQLASQILEEWDRSGQETRSRASSPQSRFFPAIQYMAEHLADKVSREQLAAAVHLNANYFDKAFCDVYGVTPMQMLRQMRMNKARSMLEADGVTLTDIAAQCGLCDASYFSRQFVKHLGVTPGTYKKRVESARRQIIGENGMYQANLTL
ncbi:helix-turn-helix domain-containing protein [Paenibacillus gansuensis]|uniref:Helix-turn-helix domain-containing protein n=1 Tax=Paenibacillus gansuensis TaxID=306542 RepID=A0ABW5PKL1_9BACL